MNSKSIEIRNTPPTIDKDGIPRCNEACLFFNRNCDPYYRICPNAVRNMISRLAELEAILAKLADYNGGWPGADPQMHRIVDMAKAALAVKEVQK